MLIDLTSPGAPDDEAVYRAVMTGHEPTTQEVADVLGWEVGETDAALGRLTTEGFVSVLDDGAPGAHDLARRRWSASPPELVLAPLLARSHERLRRAESTFAELVETYHRERAPQSATELIEIVEGADAQAHRLTQLESSARRTLSAFQSGRNTVVSVSDAVAASEADVAAAAVPAPADEDALPGPAASIAFRAVVDAAFLREPDAIRKLDQWIAEGYDVRVIDEPVIKLVIADDEVAMVQVSPRRSVMLRRPLVTLAIELFETTWRSARPYLNPGGGLEPEDRRILELMLAGLTDSTVAAQLGMSPRTVQRRLKAVMDVAGVSSRVQLGWHAVRQGWV